MIVRTYQVDVGEIHVGRPYRSERGHRRVDEFHSIDGRRIGNDSISVADADDDSDQHSGYDPACACCWLNHAHSVDRHVHLTAK